MDHLAGLNEAQKEAATHKDGPLLIVAGAGAGKTKTIAHRIANLVVSGVDPRRILAVTFTNKAAREMGERINSLLATIRTDAPDWNTKGSPWGPGLKGNPLYSPANRGNPTISTFHSLGAMILRDNAEAAGINRRFTICDESEAISAIKKAAKDCGFGPKEVDIKAIRTAISREKNFLNTPDTYEGKQSFRHFAETVRNVWEAYDKRLKAADALDFDDLIQKTVFLLRDNAMVRERYQTLWQYIHVDEYQDTNTAQYEMSRLLADGHKNFCVVGDSDQSIYGWRQADFRNILNFESNFPGASVVLLEENYRSTKTILAAANTIIKKNTERKEKTLFTNNGEGEKISVYEALDENDEARYVVAKSNELIRSGAAHAEEIAILYRANWQSRVLEENFLRHDLPYQILGVRFYDRKEVKDIIAFLKLALNPKDRNSFERAVDAVPTGIGDATIEKIFSGRLNELAGKTGERVNIFLKTMAAIANVVSKEKTSEAIKSAIKISGIEKYLLDNPEGGEERLANLHELVTLAQKYDIFPQEEAMEKFLTDVALLSDQDSLDKKGSGIKLMTVHASKGLEFKYVFVVGMEQDLFPHQRFGSDAADDPEEERRLFYVAVTRAGKKLFLTFACFRTIFGQQKMNAPSEFLRDLPDELVELETSEQLKRGRERAITIGEDSADDIDWDCLG